MVKTIVNALPPPPPPLPLSLKLLICPTKPAALPTSRVPARCVDLQPAPASVLCAVCAPCTPEGGEGGDDPA